MPLRLSRAMTALLVFAGSAPPAVAEPASLTAQACLGCHGHEGRGAGDVPAIAGRDAAELRALLLAFRAGERPATIMDRISRGYSAAELGAAAEHFAKVR